MTESQKKFADEIAGYVKELGSKYNIKVVSPIVAQAILESGWGTSNKAKYNNFFGLKYRENRVTCHNGTFVDGSSEQNPDGSYIPITDQWYSFETVKDGVEGYLQFINISRYDNLKNVTDWEKYIELIRADGYATSLTYVENLKNVVKNNNLTQYDTETEQEDTTMSNITVHLDPGHYGSKYNQGVNKNYYESAMTWKLAGYLKSELENKGIKVTLSRSSIDKDPSLYDRGYGSKGKTLFLSLHSNACSSESVDYPLVIRSIKSDDSALDLANKLGQVIRNTMGTSQNYKVITKQGSNGDYYGVIRGAAAAGLNYNYILEHGFHTNTKNCNWLLSGDNLKTLAKKEADAIASFFNVKKSTTTTTETKTEEKKEENKTTTSTTTNTTSTYTTGMYKVNVNSLNIRKGPGTDYVVVGCIKDKGTYTIVEIKNGSWGRLKSGAGWINCHKNYCTKSKTTSSTTTKTTATAKKNNEEIAREVLQGKWGNGSERKKKLESAGYNYSTVQSIVNKLCK